MSINPVSVPGQKVRVSLERLDPELLARKRKLLVEECQNLEEECSYKSREAPGGSSRKRLCLVNEVDHMVWEENSKITKGFPKVECSHWDKLPEHLLIKIMLWLPKKSRLNMALTCRRWSRAIDAAALWRTLDLELTNFRQIDKSIINYTKRHAKHIRHLCVKWIRPSFVISSRLHKGITQMISQLQDSSLIEFQMRSLELERYWRYECRKERLIQTLVSFLGGQKKIQAFVLDRAQIGLAHASQILVALAKACSKAVTFMNIKDLLNSRQAAYRTNAFMDALGSFTNLTTLCLNYNCLNEEIVENFANAGQLRNLSVKIYRYDPHAHLIPSSSWATLKKRCNGLEVRMEFDQLPEYSTISQILVPNVPLKAVHIWSGYMEEDNWMICESIRHISCLYPSTLEFFELEVENDSEVIDEEIINCVHRCKRLNQMIVNAVLDVDTVAELCQLRQRNKTALHTLVLTLAGPMETDTHDILEDIRASYADMIEANNLDYQFSCESIVESESEAVHAQVQPVINHPGIAHLPENNQPPVDHPEDGHGIIPEDYLIVD